MLYIHLPYQLGFPGVGGIAFVELPLRSASDRGIDTVRNSLYGMLAFVHCSQLMRDAIGHFVTQSRSDRQIQLCAKLSFALPTFTYSSRKLRITNSTHSSRAADSVS